MKKAIIVLYNTEVSEIIRYRQMICNYEIVQVVSPSGWGLSRKDAGSVDGGKPTEYIIRDDIDYSIEFDVVLLLTPITENLLCQVYNTYLKKAIQEGKIIVCTKRNGDFLAKSFNDCENHIMVIEENPKHEIKRMGKIDTPIIVVAGTHEYTHKFKLQLELKKYLQKNGYKATLIGSKNFSKIFDCYQFPTFMFRNISEREKILAFQGYIRNIEKDEEPDIIIIGVPGGMMPFNEKFPGNFGITLYEVMLAVQPDAFILSCLYEEYDNEYFEEIRNVAKYRFGTEVDCFNISTFQVDINESEQNDSLQYFRLSHEAVDSMIKNLTQKIPIFNVSNGEDGTRMAEFITHRLEEYSEAEFV